MHASTFSLHKMFGATFPLRHMSHQTNNEVTTTLFNKNRLSTKVIFILKNDIFPYLSGLRFASFKTLLSQCLISTFPIKNSARRENCDSRAWGISTMT
jgi:hypothetical protein